MEINVTYEYVLGDQVGSLALENVLCFHQVIFVMSQRLVECYI